MGPQKAMFIRKFFVYNCANLAPETYNEPEKVRPQCQRYHVEYEPPLLYAKYIMAPVLSNKIHVKSLHLLLILKHTYAQLCVFTDPIKSF